MLTNKFLAKISKEKSGFTLIEVLLVVTIIGILSSIALATFQHYRDLAFDITIQSDLNNFSKAQGMYFNDHQEYIGAVGESLSSSEGNDYTLPGFRTSKGVKITILSSPDPFIAQGQHTQTDSIFNCNVETSSITKL